jgi:transcriptional regulator with XRE-family HTH domain
MNGETQLGDFLQARRSQLRPEDAGVRTYGERRRVPGLRREELALLAGVSPSYYTRLEQGQSLSASAEVLDAFFPDIPEHAWKEQRAMLVPDPPAARLPRPRQLLLR